jgi:hypothetical protein
MNDLFAYAELKPWFSLAVGILGLVGIVVATRNLSRRPAVAALTLIVSGATAVLCLFQAWSIYDNPPTHISMFGGCSLPLLVLQAAATAVLILLCSIRRRESG